MFAALYVGLALSGDAMPCPCGDMALCRPLSSPAAETEIFAFATQDGWKTFLDYKPRPTTVAMFGSSGASPELVCTAHALGTRVVTGEDFPKTELGNSSARLAWVESLVLKMQTLGLDGFNIDIEGNSGHRDDLTSLIKQLAIAVRDVNPLAQLSFALAIGPKGQTSGYNHAELASVLDFIVPMAYDECWSTGVAAANSPIDALVSGVQQYQDLGVRPEQLVLGLPWYGWDFPCDSNVAWDRCSITVPTGQDWYGYATQISYKDANATATSVGEARYEDSSMTAFTEYVAADGQRHQRWFDNPKTLAAKYAASGRLGVRGVAFWTADHVDYTTSQGKDMWDALAAFHRSVNTVRYLPASCTGQDACYIYSTRDAANKACRSAGFDRLCNKADSVGHPLCKAGWYSDGIGYWMDKASAGCGKAGFNDWGAGSAGAYCCSSASLALV